MFHSKSVATASVGLPVSPENWGAACGFYRFLCAIGNPLFLILLVFLSACVRPPGIGIGGRYLDARSEITRRGGNIQVAIQKLEEVVQKDPFYRDSLTLLGRAYYLNGRYRDAFQILKRAVVVNQKDEIAWIALGLTQLRLGEDQQGLESLKGGITLLNQASKDGYKGIEFWDRNHLVRTSLRKTVLLITKGLEAKAEIIQSGEALLSRIDEEERYGKRETFQEGIMRD